MAALPRLIYPRDGGTFGTKADVETASATAAANLTTVGDGHTAERKALEERLERLQNNYRCLLLFLSEEGFELPAELLEFMDDEEAAGAA